MSVSPVKTRITTIPRKPNITFVYQNCEPIANRSPINQNKMSHINPSNKENSYSRAQQRVSVSPAISKFPPLSPKNIQCGNKTKQNRLPVFLKDRINNNNTFQSESQKVGQPHVSKFGESMKNANTMSISNLKTLNTTTHNEKNAKMLKFSQISQLSGEESFRSVSSQPIFGGHIDDSNKKNTKNRLSVPKNDLKCEKCQHKTASYEVSQSKIYLCCQCSISQMISGSDLSEIAIDNRSATISSPSSKQNSMYMYQGPVIKQPSKQMQAEQLLSQIESQKKSLIRMCQSLQNQPTHITNFYRNKKYQLKQHYQKIKVAIKESIQRDLKQLELCQSRQKSLWQEQTQHMNDQLKKLSQIQKDLKQNWQECQKSQGRNRSSHLTDYQQYYNIINRCRLNSSKMTNGGDPSIQENQAEMPIRISSATDENLQSNFSMSFKEPTKKQINLYQPNQYRKHMPRQNNNQVNKKGVLFSFEGINRNC